MGERGERAGLQAEGDVAHIKEGVDSREIAPRADGFELHRPQTGRPTHTRVTMQDELSLSLSLGMGGCRYERRAPTPTTPGAHPSAILNCCLSMGAWPGCMGTSENNRPPSVSIEHQGTCR